MSTALPSITQTWQNLVSGPTSAFAIQALTNRVYYQLVVSQPGETDRGHSLDPGDGTNVQLTGTDNLWVRTANTANDQLAITN